MKDFRLPDPGEGLVEAEIVSWRVAVGDEVKVNDIVVEVETSKSLVELPIPFAGTVSELLVPEGQMVDVGAPIIRIDDGVAGDSDAASAAGSGEHAAGGSRGVVPPSGDSATAAGGSRGVVPPSGDRVANLVGYGPRTAPATRRARRATHAAPTQIPAHGAVASAFEADAPVSRRADVRAPLNPVPAQGSGQSLPPPGEAHTEPGVATGAVLAKPPVRKLAKDLGVDLSALAGSGAGGIITRADVEQAASPAASPAARPGVRPVPAAPSGEDTRIPIKGVRKVTAEAMVASAFTAPHVTEWISCDVTATMELVERLKARRDFSDVRVSPTLIIARAACLALRANPMLNSTWDGERGEIVVKGEVNLGIAAATPRGLVVPNITSAQRLGLHQLAERLTELVTTAKQGRTQPADMSGGSFTITNVGVFGVDGGTPILNRGESGILCVGQIARRPWVVGTGPDERIEPRWVTTLAVAFDHRVVDGEQGSRFLADVAGILTDPGLALLY